MSDDGNNPAKLAFSTRCLPGSVAAEREQERLAEFHRSKALRKAEQARAETQAAARREEQYLADSKAFQERSNRKRTPLPTRSFLRPEQE